MLGPVKTLALLCTLGSMVVSSGILRAGAWTSGGGEIIKDGGNPWFIQNTTDVRYCVLKGEHFSLPQDQAEDRIAEAFAYWKNEFARVEYTINIQRQSDIPPADRYGVRVATQSFTKVSCLDDHDLVFQLGILTNERQRQHLVDPRKVVGVAVRTEYDRVHLRGRGFIYIGADSGPDHVELDEGNPWSGQWAEHGGRGFFEVVLHEIGHVFGLPHVDHIPALSKGHVMSARAPEIVIARGPGYAGMSLGFDRRSEQTLGRQITFGDGTLSRFFGESDPKLWWMELVPRGPDIFSVEFIDREFPSHSARRRKVVGELRLAGARSLRSEPVIVVLCPPEENVLDCGHFAPIPEWVSGAGVLVEARTGEFVSQDGTRRHPAFLRTTGTSFEIGAFFEGRLIPNIFETAKSPSPQ